MKKRLIAVSILILAMLFVFTACGEEEYDETSKFEQITHGKVAMYSNAPAEPVLREKYPEMTIEYQESASNMALSLMTNSIDAFVIDEPAYIYFARSMPELAALSEPIMKAHTVMIFPNTDEGAALRDEFNAFLAEVKSSGKYAEIEQKWIYDGDFTTDFDFNDLSGENGTLTMGAGTSAPPHSMMVDGKVSGMELELMYLFCDSRGYGLDASDVVWSAMMTGVTTGIYDVGGSGTVYFDELDGMLNYSDPVCEYDIVFVTEGNSEVSDTPFFKSLGERLHKILIEEDRWKLVLTSFGTTALISVLAVAFGTLLGYGLFLINRKKKKIISPLIALLNEIISCMPPIIFLMLLYYVVFGSLSFSGVAVSSIGFALMFAFTVMNQLKTGTEGIDAGQRVAAMALGYTDNKAFIKFVLPQVRELVAPLYSGSVVELIKTTSIVGFISVCDLTRAVEVIRSRTFEAFLPLVISALLYYLLIKIAMRITKPKPAGGRKEDWA